MAVDCSEPTNNVHKHRPEKDEGEEEDEDEARGKKEQLKELTRHVRGEILSTSGQPLNHPPRGIKLFPFREIIWPSGSPGLLQAHLVAPGPGLRVGQTDRQADLALVRPNRA